MSKVFKFYHDAGHGWLAVKKNLLENLGLDKAISGFSYVKGKTVYLEEDSDLTLFKNTYEQLHGPLQTVSIDHGDRSWVRNMPAYTKTLNLTKDVAGDVVSDTPKSEF